MKVQLTYQLEVPDDTNVQQLQDDLEFPEDVQVVGQSQAMQDAQFTVVGTVKGKPTERWTEQVYASNEAEAEEKAKEKAPKDTEYTVAASFPTGQPGPLVIGA